jgi:aminocarboxymuconate-semialdehyde decarboxylase
MQAIDFHAHLAVGDASKEPPSLRAMFDPDSYLEHQAANGIELTVLSNALMGDMPGDELAEARTQHDFLAGLVESHPDHFTALAGVNPWGGPRWLDEAERALDAGFAGLVLQASRDGQYLDAPEAQEFFALADDRGTLVFVHPSASPITDEQTGDPMLTMWIGRPYDTGVCLSRMLMANTLAGYPNLKLVVAHGGGVVPMVLGRLDHVHEMHKRVAAFAAVGAASAGGPGGRREGGGPPFGGPPAGGGPPFGGPPGGGGPPFGGPPDTHEKARGPSPDLDGESPSERIRNIYLDTACYHPSGVWATIAAVGVDHVVFGSDHPPVDRTPQPSIDLINQLELRDEDRDKILAGNARRLLGR